MAQHSSNSNLPCTKAANWVPLRNSSPFALAWHSHSFWWVTLVMSFDVVFSKVSSSKSTAIGPWVASASCVWSACAWKDGGDAGKCDRENGSGTWNFRQANTTQDIASMLRNHQQVKAVPFFKVQTATTKSRPLSPVPAAGHQLVLAARHAAWKRHFKKYGRNMKKTCSSMKSKEILKSVECYECNVYEFWVYTPRTMQSRCCMVVLRIMFIS